jgi:hypothetical protein
MIHVVFHLKQVVIVCIGRKITSRKGLHVASMSHGLAATIREPLKTKGKILQQIATWIDVKAKGKAR